MVPQDVDYALVFHLLDCIIQAHVTYATKVNPRCRNVHTQLVSRPWMEAPRCRHNLQQHLPTYCIHNRQERAPYSTSMYLASGCQSILSSCSIQILPYLAASIAGATQVFANVDCSQVN